MKKTIFLSLCIVSISANALSWTLASLPEKLCYLRTDCIFYPYKELVLMGYPLKTGNYTCHVKQKYSISNLILHIERRGAGRGVTDKNFSLEKGNSSEQDIAIVVPAFYEDEGYFLISAIESIGWLSDTLAEPQVEIIINCKKSGDKTL